jgi:putative transposase
VPFFEKQLRLPKSHYIGRQSYFVTIVTENRSDIFVNFSEGRWLLEELSFASSRYRFQIHAYCVMPDHLHLLAEGTEETSDLTTFVEGFKQRTAFGFARRTKQRLWQRRYYDHILRPNESPEDVACYIWWNPVRKNLCADPTAYPLTGSQTIDWMKRSPSPTTWKPTWK